MLVRRLLLIAAVLMLLTALAAGLSPRAPVTGSGSLPATAAALPAGTVVTSEIRAAAGARRVAVRRGDTLVLEVAGDVLDSVLIERLDRIEAIEPEKKARFEILIDAPAGAYPIRLVDADRRIGTLEISD